uniref:Ig-like domain-containing protein n=1 Tax=Astyanax mexicanus TaxID=7994 RepID=A0A8B9I0Y2_ASTMX
LEIIFIFINLKASDFVSFLLSCWFCIAERFNVVGPDAPLVAEAGEDLVLPCSLQPNISAEGMMVEWLRTDLTDRQVHLYKDYKDTNDDQIKTYRGRTALFKEELKKGNTSLKLSALQPSDEGSYKCLIKSESWYEDFTLRVEINGKDVRITGEDLVLPCFLQPSISAEGGMVEWIRQHETDRQVHLYADYKDRNDNQMESYRGRTALFKEELKKGNASLKLSALQPSDDGAYKCLIRSFGWNDDVTLYVEVKGEKHYNLLMILHICCTNKLSVCNVAIYLTLQTFWHWYNVIKGFSCYFVPFFLKTHFYVYNSIRSSLSHFLLFKNSPHILFLGTGALAS